MKKTLLFVLALAVIPVGVDAQVTELAQLRALAEQGDRQGGSHVAYQDFLPNGRSHCLGWPSPFGFVLGCGLGMRPDATRRRR